MGEKYYEIGYIGLTNLTVLLFITLYRTMRWVSQYEESGRQWDNKPFRKKAIFHILLLLTIAFDIPMYITFCTTGEYVVAAYSFHRLQSMFLFGALSITISDWASVLHDIHEYDISHFLFRKVTLITINLIYVAISLINFIFCFALSDLDAYIHSPVYVTAIFFQISVSILLTAMMLHAGLKLYNRISGAAGTNTDSFNRSTNNPLTRSAGKDIHKNAGDSQKSNGSSHNANGANKKLAVNTKDLEAAQEEITRMQVFDGTAEFKSALRNLNLVMAACTLCIFLEMIMTILNYALGYANNSDKTVGPRIFYWTCYSWVPLWGPILALLYLSRSQNARKRAKFFTARPPSSGEGMGEFLQSPLIGEDDYLTLSGSLHGKAGLKTRFLSRVVSDETPVQYVAYSHDSSIPSEDNPDKVISHELEKKRGRDTPSDLNTTTASTRMSTSQTSRPSNASTASSATYNASTKRVFSQHAGLSSVTESGELVDTMLMIMTPDARTTQHTNMNTISTANTSGYYMDTSANQLDIYDDNSTQFSASNGDAMRMIMEGGLLPNSREQSGEVGDDESAFSPDSSMRYIYRDTSATNPLPSELYFPRLHSNDRAHDFSYRGGEEHNGHFK